MNHHLILGDDWPAPLVEKLARTLTPWRVTLWTDASVEQIRDADVIVPIHRRIDRALLKSGGVRLIHQFGVGVDNIDLPAMKALGIAVANAPSEISGMSATVAEGAVLLVLSCARLPSLRAANLAEGTWNWTVPLNLGLAGRRVGLIGLGSIGKAIARRLLAFDMKVAAVRRSASAPGEAEAMGLEWIGTMDRLTDLVESSDMVVICAPLNEATRCLFDAALIARMKPAASLVNVGRGGIVVEAALLAALDEGKIHAAGLDTITVEPPAPNSPLLSNPRIVLTPHDAGVSDKAFEGVAGIIAANLKRLESGKPLLNRIV